MDADKGLPALIAFDLDYTLWDLWIDTHVTGPLKASGSPNLILDRFGEPIFFYPDVPGILHEVHGKTTLALCSRTSAPDLAREALRLLMIPPASTGGSNASPTPATEFFTQKEIYPGSKIQHFRALHKKTGIPYSEMLFFDDESRNREVESLGVTFILVKNGTNRRVFWDGVKAWRRKVHEVN
ncbi:hypothetical protein PIIN_05956 [Serendipita indica DSM 11827]|uniref:Magnesium-dependent phosphatase-1 n=1 Tax=Serendipita indica (strain DSM 11827) TaxID=1109443 RepID=G4TL20_SERID|nr:hypothetical protein PIIN_05956 [Serendipita indica DSM 11827]